MIIPYISYFLVCSTFLYANRILISHYLETGSVLESDISLAVSNCFHACSLILPTTVSFSFVSFTCSLDTYTHHTITTLLNHRVITQLLTSITSLCCRFFLPSPVPLLPMPSQFLSLMFVGLHSRFRSRPLRARHHQSMQRAIGIV